MDRAELQRRYPALIQSKHASFSAPENIKLMLRLGLVRPDAESWDFFECWGKLIRFGYGHERLARIKPDELVRLKEKLAGVLPFGPRNTSAAKVEAS